MLCKWRPTELRWRNALYGGPKLAPKWSEPRRILQITGTPPARIKLQSAWYATPPMEASIHDVRLIPAFSHPSYLQANLKYVISSLDNPCANAHRDPSILPLSQAMNNMLPKQMNEQIGSEIALQRPPRVASEAEDKLWPTTMAIAASLRMNERTGKVKRLDRCDAVFFSLLDHLQKNAAGKSSAARQGIAHKLKEKEGQEMLRILTSMLSRSSLIFPGR